MALDGPRLRDFASQPLSTLELAEPTLVSHDTSIKDAVAAMRAADVSAVVVVEHGAVRGLLDDVEVGRLTGDGADWTAPAAGATTAAATTLESDQPIERALRLLSAGEARAVVVTRAGAVTGVVRDIDLLRHIAELFPEEILNLPPRPDQQLKSPEGA